MDFECQKFDCGKALDSDLTTNSILFENFYVVKTVN